MAFSFEPFLAISSGQIMAVSAGPEHYVECVTTAVCCERTGMMFILNSN